MGRTLVYACLDYARACVRAHWFTVACASQLRQEESRRETDMLVIQDRVLIYAFCSITIAFYKTRNLSWVLAFTFLFVGCRYWRLS